MHPEREFKRKDILWKEIGFQGEDPVTDIRAGGVLSLACFSFYSTYYTGALKHILGDLRKLQKEYGYESGRYYPIATMAVVLSAKLCEMLKIAKPMLGPIRTQDFEKVIKKKTGSFGKLIVPEIFGENGKWSGASFYEIFSFVLTDFHLMFVEREATYMESQHLVKETMKRLKRFTKPSKTIQDLKCQYSESHTILRKLLKGEGGRSKGWRLARGLVSTQQTRARIQTITNIFSNFPTGNGDDAAEPSEKSMVSK